MSLAPGSRLGPYEVSTLLGVGGMGEVYAATDVNLARPVAIKVLPDAVAADADRLSRFEREARTLASLNHPNIAAIYGLERTAATTALVIELVDGPTLADRILDGPIPLDEALAIAKQIAEALEAAHEHGVVHRDLKPANVKVRSDGRVKVLDFGLAKVVETASTTSGTISRSPTITTPAMTQSGVILGTAAYMSPEQARGKPVDKRADVWAFGCVLFEMLTGRRVFHNDEVSDTLAMVLTRDPDWSQLPADTPESIRRLLRRSLVKDRGARLPDIGGARLEIDDAQGERRSAPASAGSSSGATGVRSPGWFALAAGTIAVAALATLGTWVATRPRPIAQPITRALLGVAPADRLMTGHLSDAMGMGRPSRTAMAFTPDGRTLVFSAERDGRVQLFMRRLDQLDAAPIPGTDGVSNLFMSPGGDAVGFYADGALKRVSLNGGAPVEIAKVDLVFGASWGRDDRIVFATQTGGLWRIHASGGKPESITALQPDEYSHRLPHVLPDGHTVLFTSTSATFPRWDDTRIIAKSLVSGQQSVVVESGADARYVPTGHLVYIRQGTLMAVPFDIGKVEVTGAAVGLLPNVMQSAAIQPVQVDSGAGQFTVSESGSLAYITGGIHPQDRWSIGWVDRRTRAFEPLKLPAGSYLAPRLSPDGKRVVYNTTSDDWDLWIYEVSRGLATRLPMEDEQSVAVWTPDSSRVVFSSRLSGGGKLLVQSADGNGAPETLPISFPPKVGPAFTPFANAWATDGSLVFWYGSDVWLSTPAEREKPRPLVTSALAAEFSPDGRWIAYTAGRGPFRNQIYAQPYPAMGGREQVTGEGTFAPVWRGNELFFIETAPDRPANVRVVAVTVTTTPAFEIGPPRLLFEGPFRIDGPFRGYDVTADGQRFLMVRAVERPPERVTQMVFVQNWFGELRGRVPAR